MTPLGHETRVAMSDFSLLLCGCGHAFVRSNKRGTSWACPKCFTESDVDALVDSPGPERDVDSDEFDRLCGFRQVAT
jgi:hypothetical protein